MEHVNPELPELLMGALSDADRKRIEQHLAACPSCREVWREIRVLDRAGSVEARPSVPPGYFNVLAGRILDRRRTGDTGRTRSPWWAPVAQYTIPLAAGILVIFGLLNVSPNATERRMDAGLPLTSAEAAEFVATDDALSVIEMASSDPEYLAEAVLVSRDPDAGLTPGLEDLEPQVLRDLVSDLSDDEVERLIDRLNERSVL